MAKKIVTSLIAILAIASTVNATADMSDTIERIKPSIVIVGTYKKTNSPQFSLSGTGFVIGNGNLIATNAHVVPENMDPDAPVVVIQARNANGELQSRRAFPVIRDKAHDIAVLRIEGAALPALKLRNAEPVREGDLIGFTGFPIGGALGFSPVTHRGMISSITPIALPSGNANQLNEKAISRLKSGAFNIFQLDATAYPGNSGSPVFDAESGDVIGIINMVFIKGSKETALSQPSGISYAIPVIHLLDALKRMPAP